MKILSQHPLYITVGLLYCMLCARCLRTQRATPFPLPFRSSHVLWKTKTISVQCDKRYVRNKYNVLQAREKLFLIQAWGWGKERIPGGGGN